MFPIYLLSIYLLPFVAFKKLERTVEWEYNTNGDYLEEAASFRVLEIA